MGLKVLNCCYFYSYERPIHSGLWGFWVNIGATNAFVHSASLRAPGGRHKSAVGGLLHLPCRCKGLKHRVILSAIAPICFPACGRFQ
jgi:hypothetical protein